MIDREVLQMIANCISQDQTPDEILKTVATMLHFIEVEPQVFQTLRYWPDESRDRIAENSKRIPANAGRPMPAPQIHLSLFRPVFLPN